MEQERAWQRMKSLGSGNIGHALASSSSGELGPTPKGKARGLTAGEIAMARLVFRDAIDYAAVNVHNRRYLWFGVQPANTAMTPNGAMYFDPSRFREDFSDALHPAGQVWFMHEMTHVWQYQLGYPVKWRGALRLGLSYEYIADKSKRLCDYNMEAQGDIVADYFALKFLDDPSWVRQNPYKRNSAMTLLEGLLGEFIDNPSDPAHLPRGVAWRAIFLRWVERRRGDR